MADGFSRGFWERTLKAAYPAKTQYKLALYLDDPSDLRSYEKKGEWKGSGYAPGGEVVKGYEVKVEGEVAKLHFSNVSWIGADVEARYALLYAADDGRALRVFDMGRKVGVIGGLFEFMFPEDGALQMGNKEQK